MLGCGKFMVSTSSVSLSLQVEINVGSSKNLPSSQRRGAIMILGMLAVADKGIVENQIDTMLKVGFGKQGTVSPVSLSSSPKTVDIVS